MLISKETIRWRRIFNVKSDFDSLYYDGATFGFIMHKFTFWLNFTCGTGFVIFGATAVGLMGLA